MHRFLTETEYYISNSEFPLTLFFLEMKTKQALIQQTTSAMSFSTCHFDNMANLPPLFLTWKELPWNERAIKMAWWRNLQLIKQIKNRESTQKCDSLWGTTIVGISKVLQTQTKLECYTNYKENFHKSNSSTKI